MILKKSIRGILAYALLLCFAAAAFPVDLLHNHGNEQTHCRESSKHSSCNHKVHISKKSYCFACTVHFDKNFTFSYYPFQVAEQPHELFFIDGYLAAYIAEILSSYLRGPPFK